MVPDVFLQATIVTFPENCTAHWFSYNEIYTVVCIYTYTVECMYHIL